MSSKYSRDKTITKPSVNIYFRSRSLHYSLVHSTSQIFEKTKEVFTKY